MLHCRLFPAVALLGALLINPFSGLQAAEPVKIFILAGQSNMVGHGNMTPATDINTLEHLVDPANDTAGNYQFLRDGADWKTWDDVWIHYLARKGNLTTGYGTTTSHVGPEIGFGHVVSEQYENQVLLIKCAWGGKSLGNDFLPPSAENYPTPQGDGDKGFYYAEILRLVSLVTSDIGAHFPGYAGQGYEIAGFGWHQGYNDRVNTDFSAAYQTNMAHFIRDMRSADKGLDVPELPFVIVTSAMDGNGPGVYSQVEMAQRAMVDPFLTNDNPPDLYPDFAGSVAVVDARQTYDGLQFWYAVQESPVDQGFHWNRNAKTYVNIGLAMGDAMVALSPGRCPSRLRASGVASGIELTWQNGEETPTSVQILRNGMEIAAAAPGSPTSFIDTTALPGIHHYELVFTMPDEACGPLTVTFDGSIRKLLAFRSPGGIGLTWENPMTYAGIEIRRDDVLLEPSLSGNATSYTDTSPLTSGIVTYTVNPTTGTSTVASSQINLNGLPAGSALIYEPFDYEIGGLNGKSGISEVGLSGTWTANSSTLVTPGTLSYGSLPVGGGKLSDFTGGVNRFGGTRSLNGSALADEGMLDDGATLWFSLLMGYDAGGNRANTRLAFVLGDESQSTGNNTYYMNSPGATGLGVNLGTPNGHIRAFLMTDQNTANQFGNSPAAVLPSSNTNIDYAFVVGRITWGAASDTIDIFLPGTDLGLGPVHSTLTVNVDQSGYDTISFARGDKVVLDEIRFGASYESVTGADVDPDIDPPTPNPAAFAEAPAAISDSAITMTSVIGTDASGPVEYLFTETSGTLGGSSSSWQTSPSYTDEGLEPSTQYTYTVTMRDRLGNTGTASEPVSATTDTPDTTTPSPNPMTWESVPTATSATAISMTATTATDDSGVEYYFTNISGGGNDSGWQDSPVYTDTDLIPSTTYTYEVKARDKSSNQNETSPSPALSATTNDAPGGPGGAVAYEPFDYAAGGLNGASGGTGWAGNWSANASATVVATDLTYGSLPTSGGSIGVTGGVNHFGGARAIDLATQGLLADGTELWFSMNMGYNAGGNRSNAQLTLVLGDESMSTANGTTRYHFTTVGATGLGVTLSRFGGTGGRIVATEMGDTSNSTSIFGTGQNTVVLPATNTTVDYAFVVGRITWGATEDTIDLFLPGTDLTLGEVHSTLTVDVNQSGYDTVSWRRGDAVVLDEIRFGADYESVIGQGGTTPPSDYDAWAAEYPGADLSDPNADFDGDGMTNYEEWIWGLNPTSGSSVSPILSPLDSDSGTLTYQRRNPALTNATFGYEWSTTLQAEEWNAFTPSSEDASGESPVETVEITVPAGLLENGKLFVRILATSD